MPRDFFHPSGFTVWHGDEAGMVDLPFEGAGYQFEAAEVHRCLREGLTESPLVPLAETLDILTVLDVVRVKVGLDYSSLTGPPDRSGLATLRDMAKEIRADPARVERSGGCQPGRGRAPRRPLPHRLPAPAAARVGLRHPRRSPPRSTAPATLVLQRRPGGGDGGWSRSWRATPSGCWRTAFAYQRGRPARRPAHGRLPRSDGMTGPTQRKAGAGPRSDG